MNIEDLSLAELCNTETKTDTNGLPIIPRRKIIQCKTRQIDKILTETGLNHACLSYNTIIRGSFKIYFDHYNTPEIIRKLLKFEEQAGLDCIIIEKPTVTIIEPRKKRIKE